MTALQKAFAKILKEYQQATNENLKNHSISLLLRHEIPRLIEPHLKPHGQYVAQGSVGQGSWADTPWLCIFDKDITTSAQKGYYCVYLFNCIGEQLYLNLGIGWTQFQGRDARKRILNAANFCRSQLNEQIAALHTNPIALDRTSPLSKGYEAGHICHKRYDAQNMPNDNVLLDDLGEMLKLYQSLKTHIGKQDLVKGFEEFQEKFVREDNAKDASFQQEIEHTRPKETKPGPQSKKKPSKTKGSVRWQRDPGISKTALINSNYQCAVDKNHTTFISKATGKPYVEAHHLIPYARQDDFEFSLDVPENVLSLCPLCHRQFHHAETKQRDLLIEFFYKKRKTGLVDRKIDLPLSKLKDYY